MEATATMAGPLTQDTGERTGMDRLQDSILETANEAFIATDRNGVIRQWNRAAERLLGWDRDEIIGRSVLETVIPPSLLDEFVGGLARYLETGERHLLGNQLERSALRRDGEEIPIELSSGATGSGADLTFYAFIRDISERQEFERGRERAARHFELSHDLIATLSADMRVHDVNGRWQELLGWTPEELRDRPVTELIHPDDRDSTVEEVVKGARSGVRTGFRNRLRTKDGAWRWIEWSAVAVPDENLAYASGRDVTDRMEAEQGLRDAARHFDLTHDLVCTATPDGYFEAFNGRWEATLGWTPDELRRRPFIQLIHPDDRATTARGVAGVLEGDDMDGLVNRYRTADGTWCWLEWSAAMDFDQDRIYASARDVTQRMEAEERLKEAARHFRLSHDLVCTAGPDGAFLTSNDRWESTLGWTPDELRAGTLTDFIHPDDLAATGEEITRIVEGEESSEFVNRFRAKDGGWHWLEWTGASEPGKEVVYASARDVTDRIEAELAYGQLGAIVESSGDAIYGYSLDGVITSWNEAAEHLLGYAAAEAVGMPISALVPPDLPDDSGAIIDRVASGELVEDKQAVRLASGGEHLDVSLTVSPVRDAMGKIIGASSIARDISDRVRSWRYIRAQHQATSVLARAPDASALGKELLPILSGCADWICAAYWTRVGDSDGFRCDATWTAPRLHGPIVPVHEGETWESSKDSVDNRLGEVTWDGGPGSTLPMPASEMARTGGLQTALWVPVLSYDHVEGGFEFFARDHRDADIELLNALASVVSQVGHYVERRQAEQGAERMKNEFFSLISHELRTPLTSIIGYTELLDELESERLSEQGRRSLEVVERNARRELHLVTDLLTLVHIESGTFTVEPEHVDLKQIAEEAVEAARPTAERHGVRLRLRSDVRSGLEADPQRMGQVVDNLLTNAIKFSPDGGEVRVRVQAGDGHASIEVSDNGIGISPEDRDRLFERLFRTEGATAMRVPGTGLGLTIVKAIVDAHDGQIQVESEEGVGTTFRVEMPMHALAIASDDAKEALP